MVCTSRRQPEETPAQRRARIDKALRKLAEQLGQGTARVVVGRNGAATIVGWTEREDVADACAFRQLLANGNSQMRMALARAEALAGRKVSLAMINNGTHSHDGGATWHGGH